MGLLYDDENNIVDAVVLCESGGVEVSNVAVPTVQLSATPSLVITPSSQQTAFSPRSFVRNLKQWSCSKSVDGFVSSPFSSSTINSFMTARQEDDMPTFHFEAPATPTVGTNHKETASLFDEKTVLSDEDSFDSDPFAPRAGRSLRWKNVNMVLNSSNGTPKRKILDKVDGEVPSTQTTAIMGASGSGKTSLLNVISGRVCTKGNIKVASEVFFDGVRADPTNVKTRRRIAFVAQDDSLQATATPREAIKFSARLRLPRSTSDMDIDKLADKMIEELGLTSCADTIVGGPLIKGISGGERKRTSVGVELVVKPTMIFLDEPTSGLDSFNALQVCQVLRKVAKAGASVLFTIHQPSSEIFSAFDHLILLNHGKVLYQGSVGEAQDYFELRGHPCPPNFNPADWFIAVAQNNTMDDLEKMGFFPDEDRAETTDIVSEYSSDSDETVGRPNLSASIATQVKLLFHREFIHMCRFRYPLYARYGLTIMLSTLIGTIFYDIGEADKSDPYNLQSQFGAMMCTLMMALLGTAQPSLLFFPEERPIFLREFSTDHYGVLSYFLSRFCTEAVVTGIQVFLMVVIIFYLASFQGSFLVFLCSTYALAMAGTAMAVTLGAAAQGNTKVAQQMLPLIFIPQVVFSGFFIAPDMIPVVLRWVQHVCVLTYAVRLVVVSEFHECSDDPLQAFTCNILLSKVNADPDRTWYYWMMLVVFFVSFRSLALALLRQSTSTFY